MANIIIGSDHAGHPLKAEIHKRLTEHGHQVTDLGCDGPDSVDYPDFAHAVASRVVGSAEDADQSLGILICGTGIGMSMAANKVLGIRAALCHNEFEARMCRAHNNANILCIGARVTGRDVALGLVDEFLATEFEGGRHARRVDKIEGTAHP